MITKNKKPVLAVLGATASGKSALAMEIAHHFDCEIVNCDSRQIYREMHIGTACPTEIEMRGIKHHLFDLVSPAQSFSAADYAVAAANCIQTIWKKGKVPLLTGGTGFYYSAIAEGLGEAGHDPQKAEQLRETLEKHGLEYMVDLLKKLDPESPASIDTNNARRVLRAIEIVELTGRPYSENQPVPPLPAAEFCPIVVTRPRPVLHKAIARRLDIMINTGLEKEVRNLVEKFGRDADGLNSIGYHEWFNYFDGKENIAEIKELIIIHTRQYAKRQETWFRRRPGVGMLDLNDPQQSAGIFPQITAFIKGFGL